MIDPFPLIYWFRVGYMRSNYEQDHTQRDIDGYFGDECGGNFLIGLVTLRAILGG